MMARQHQDYLYKFLDILSKLERVSPAAAATASAGAGAQQQQQDGSGGGENNGGGGQVVDEEQELRCWADLREYQLKFQEQGGIYGFS